MKTRKRRQQQKVTPQRPNLTVSQANNLQNMQRLQGSPPSGGLTRGMHASKHTGSRSGNARRAWQGSTAAAKAAAMRSRNASNASAYMAQKQQQPQQQQQQPQQQQQQPQQQQQQYQTHRPGPASSSSSGSEPGPSPAKQSAKCVTKVHAQGPPIAGATVSVPSGAGSYGQQQQPSLAPAKPKEKALIDLTDEDDAAAAAAQPAQAAQATIEANARLRLAANNAVKRNAQAAAASRGGGRGGRGGANVVRASPMQLARVNVRQIVQNNGAGQRSSVPQFPVELWPSYAVRSTR